jgi:hypothetical protein
VAREDEVHRCWCGALCPDDDSGSSAGDITCFRASTYVVLLRRIPSFVQSRLG